MALSICLTSDDFLPAATGVGTHLQTLASGLADRGHRVCVITAKPPGYGAEEHWRGVRVVRMPTVPAFGFLQALPSGRRLRELFQELSPDVVHHHYLGYMLLRAKAIATSMAIPQVYTYHMTEDHLTQPWPMRPLRPWFARRIHALCNSVDLTITVSKTLEGELRKRAIGRRVKFISNAVEFGPMVSADSTVRTSPFVVLFAGRLNVEKNIPFLMRAFAGLLAAEPKAELRIAGRGSELNALTNLAQTLGIQRSVQFLGFLDRDQLASQYATCDVFVLPSMVETQGLVAIEAMHFGKPIIVARSVITASELVSEGENGFIVEANDDRALTDRLRLLLEDPCRRLTMGARAAQVSGEYMPEVMLDAVEYEYRLIVAAQAQKR